MVFITAARRGKNPDCWMVHPETGFLKAIHRKWKKYT